MLLHFVLVSVSIKMLFERVWSDCSHPEPLTSSQFAPDLISSCLCNHGNSKQACTIIFIWSHHPLCILSPFTIIGSWPAGCHRQSRGNYPHTYLLGTMLTVPTVNLSPSNPDHKMLWCWSYSYIITLTSSELSVWWKRSRVCLSVSSFNPNYTPWFYLAVGINLLRHAC